MGFHAFPVQFPMPLRPGTDRASSTQLASRSLLYLFISTQLPRPLVTYPLELAPMRLADPFLSSSAIPAGTPKTPRVSFLW